MTRRTSYSKRAMFRKTLSRFWPLWFAYALLLLIVLPMTLFNDLQYDANLRLADVQRHIYDVTQVTPALAFCMAPLSAMCVFSHLFNDRSTGAYASLPVRRERMFVSCALAGLVPQLLAIALSALVSLGVQASVGFTALPATLTYLGIFTLHTLTFYGFAVLCAQMTGAILVVPAVYVVLQFTAVVVQTLLEGLFDVFLYGYAYSSVDITFLTPVVYTIRNTAVPAIAWEALADGGRRAIAYGFTGWKIAAIYAAAGFACLVLAFFLHRRRRMETAGDFVAVRGLRPVFKWALGLGCGLLASCFMLSLFHAERTDTVLGIPTDGAVLLFLLVGGFIGWFAADMLMKKTFRVFARDAWKGFVLFSIAAMLLMSSIIFDFFGYEKRIPAVDSIESVCISAQGDASEFRDTENLTAIFRLHRDTVATRQENEEARRNNWDDMDYTVNHFAITYALKNGKTLERSYLLCDTGSMLDILIQVENVMNSPEGIASRLPDPTDLTADRFHHSTIYYSVLTRSLSQISEEYPRPTYEGKHITLSADEAYDLYMNCILPDMEENTIGSVCFTEKSPYFHEKYEAGIDFEFLTETEDEYSREYRYYHFLPTVESRRTNAWLEAHGIEMTLQDVVHASYENEPMYQEKYGIELNPNSAEGATSVAVIGGADGPASIVVTQ